MWRRKNKVFCYGCANLLYVEGSEAPLCVATAGFVEGPIRQKIDVVGVKHAEVRNVRNNCMYWKAVDLHAWQIKRWLIWRMNNGSTKKVAQANISAYPVKKEQDNKEAILRKAEEAAAAVKAEKERESKRKDLQSRRRASSRDKRSASDTVRRKKGTKDARGGARSKRKPVHKD